MKLITGKTSKKLLLSGALITALALPLGGLPSAFATEALTPVPDPPVASAKAEAPLPETMRYNLVLNHPLSIGDAILAAEEAGIKPVAYRFENHDVVGEYSPGSSISVEELLQNLMDTYGITPAINKLIVETSTDEVRKIGTQDVATEIGANYPEVEVQSLSQDSEIGKQLQALEPASTSGEVSARVVPTFWEPNWAMMEAKRPSPTASLVKVRGQYQWSVLDAAPYVLPAHHGLEFGMNLFTDNPSVTGNVRPWCSPAQYKDVPFAKNYGWAWSAFVANPYAYGPNITNLAAQGVYADYNDLSDACNRNNVTIGLAIPQDIPLAYQSWVYIFGWEVLADRGWDDTSRISAEIQTVSTSRCEVDPWMTLTDCMGAIDSGWSDSRPVLNISRGWTAPNKCWISDVFGTVPPVSYTCGDM